MLPSSKQPGCCTLCMKEVFEVRARWPSDHPLTGEVRRIGLPLPTAVRVTFVLMSGVICDVTFCDSCTPTPDRLPEVWSICTRANAQQVEADRRAALGAGELDDLQREAYTESVRRLVVDLPIAVASIQRWEEIL